MKLPVNEVEEAKTAFKNLYDDSKEQADNILQAKLMEIEEGYQRYLSHQEHADSLNDGLDYSKSMRIGQMED